MPEVRVVNYTTTFLNDGSIGGEFPRRQPEVVWEGHEIPDDDQLAAIVSNIRPFQMRRLVDDSVLYSGYDYPACPQDIARMAPPADPQMRDRYPLANVKDVVRSRQLLIQTPRIIRNIRLGQRTLRRIWLDFDNEASN